MQSAFISYYYFIIFMCKTCIYIASYSLRLPTNAVNRGGTLVNLLCYKPEGHWFGSRWCHWNFSLTKNTSDRTMALGSTQPLTEMSTRSISWW